MARRASGMKLSESTSWRYRRARNARSAIAQVENVFFVATPLQLINALEARTALNVRRAALVVVASRTRRPQVEALTDRRDWDEVFTVPELHDVTEVSPRLQLYRSLIRARRQIDILARRLGKVDGLFLGNYGSPIGRHFASALEHQHLVLLDDGIATVAYAKARMHASTGRSRAPTLRRRLRDLAMGFRRHEPEAVSFFTSYELAAGPDDTIIRNTYARLRSVAKSHGVVPETVFLGQPLVEDRLVAEDTYVRYVFAAFQACGQQRCIYAPHPRESVERLERMRQILGCEIRSSDLPIEIEFARSGQLPSILASFWTSALDNCRILFGDSDMAIKAFVIATSDLLSGHEDSYEIYVYLQRLQTAGFEVLEIMPASARANLRLDEAHVSG